jgi:hypothetical protein
MKVCKMLGKVQDDHRQVILKLLERYTNRAEIYNFFTHTKHHSTPIYYDDIPQALGLDIIVDKFMFTYPEKRNALKQQKNLSALKHTLTSF